MNKHRQFSIYHANKQNIKWGHAISDYARMFT